MMQQYFNEEKNMFFEMMILFFEDVDSVDKDIMDDFLRRYIAGYLNKKKQKYTFNDIINVRLKELYSVLQNEQLINLSISENEIHAGIIIKRQRKMGKL